VHFGDWIPKTGTKWGEVPRVEAGTLWGTNVGESLVHPKKKETSSIRLTGSSSEATKENCIVLGVAGVGRPTNVLHLTDALLSAIMGEIWIGEGSIVGLFEKGRKDPSITKRKNWYSDGMGSISQEGCVSKTV